MCGTDFGLPEASAVCRELGFVGAANAYQDSRFGLTGAESFWLDKVVCGPEATSLTDCKHDPYGTAVSPSCGPSTIAGVECLHRRIALLDPSTLLPTSQATGILALWMGERYVPFAHTPNAFQSQRSRAVTCAELGYSHVEAVISQGPSLQLCGAASPTRALDCPSDSALLSDCSGVQINMTCSPAVKSTQVSCPTTRIVGPSGTGRGDVLVFRDGQWRGVCDQGFTDTDAEVVCTSVGLGDGVPRALIGSAFGGSSPAGFGLREPGCNGGEQSLALCPGWVAGSTGTCESGLLAGVECTPPTLRLVDGNGEPVPSAAQGYLQVAVEGGFVWAAGASATAAHAQIVCRALGFSPDAALFSAESTTQYCELAPLPGRCIGNETTLSECDASWVALAGQGCENSSSIVRIQCPSSGARLSRVNARERSASRLQGDVEMLVGGVWFVCARDRRPWRNIHNRCVLPGDLCVTQAGTTPTRESFASNWASLGSTRVRPHDRLSVWMDLLDTLSLMSPAPAMSHP